MNGDLGKIYKAINEVDKRIVEIQTTQKVRHEENKKYMKKLDRLPCDTQVEKTRSLQVKIGWCFLLIVSVLIGGILAILLK